MCLLPGHVVLSFKTYLNGPVMQIRLFHLPLLHLFIKPPLGPGKVPLFRRVNRHRLYSILYSSQAYTLD